MSQNIEVRKASHIEEAATPMNTPLNAAPIAGRDGLPQPSVATIGESAEEEDEQTGGNPASVLARNPALLNMVQDRLSTLVGKPSGYLKTLTPEVKRRVEGLKGIQTEHSKIESEFQREMLELEKKFASKYAPLYNRRAEIIAGTSEPTDEEVEKGEAVSDVDDDDEDDEEEGGATVEELDEDGEKKAGAAGGKGGKGIPDFWLVALKNHAVFGDQITDKDEEALHFLSDIRLQYLDTKQAGFKLLFHFEANEFFDDAVLEKTYYYQEEIGYGGDFVYDKAIGHEIKWKEDKDLTKKIEIKKQRNKNTNRTRVVKKIVPVDSFFNFFKPPQPPSMDALEEGNVDEEELEDLDEKLELDYQMGEDLKERIIPRAIDYYTGKALEYDDGMDDLEDEDDYDEDDYDEDDDDEAPRRTTAPETQQDPEQCKQQ